MPDADFEEVLLCWGGPCDGRRVHINRGKAVELSLPPTDGVESSPIRQRLVRYERATLPGGRVVLRFVREWSR